MISMHSWIFKNILLVFIVCMPVAVFSGLALTPILIVLTLPIVMVELPQKGQKFFWDGPAKLLALLFMWGGMSLLWTPDTERAASLWAKDIALITLGMIAAKCCVKFNKEQRMSMSRAVMWGFIIAAGLFLFELVSDGMIGRGLRLSLMGGKGQMYHYDYMNRGACFLVLCYWAWVLAIRNLERRLGVMEMLASTKGMLVQWLLVLMLLLHLASLAAVVAFLVGTVVYVTLQITNGAANKFFMWAATLVLVVTPYAVYKIDPFSVSEDYKDLPASAEHRLYIWNFAASKVAESPVTGWGFHSSADIPGAHDTIFFGENDMRELLPSHPHNMAMQMMLELGIPGFVIFVALVLTAFTKIRNSKLPNTSKSASVAVLASYLTIGCLAYSVWQEWWICGGFIAWIMLKSVMESEPAPAIQMKPLVTLQDVNLD